MFVRIDIFNTPLTTDKVAECSKYVVVSTVRVAIVCVNQTPHLVENVNMSEVVDTDFTVGLGSRFT